MNIKVQERDARVISEIAECGFLTLRQISDLCFDGNLEAAKKRLQKLQRVGIVERKRIGVLHPSIFIVGSLGSVARRLAGFAQSNPVRVPAALFVRHEILVRDFRISLILASRAGEICLKRVSIDSRELAFATSYGATRPDGYFELEDGARSLRFFFEVDNGTEPHHVLIRRAHSYQAYLRSGAFARRNGADLGLWKSHRFGVLFLFTSESRSVRFSKQTDALQLGGFAMNALINDSAGIYLSETAARQFRRR